MPAPRLIVLGGLACALVGCGGDGRASGSGGGADPDACLAPRRIVQDRCLDPGVQDDGCPAGTVGQPDGSCQPAGVPPGLCAEGFVHDGDAACEPVLPAEPCPEGLMAVPGDSACHPVLSCGDGPWGDIPVDASTVYVDQAYLGGASDGGEANPFTTIGEALAAAAPGALVAIAAGSYAEDVLIDKPVRLRGVCPEQVTVVGQGDGLGTLDLRTGASGAEVGGLSVTTNANPIAVLVSGAEGVTLEGLWVHDSAGRGINVQNDLGPTSLIVRDSLVERAQGLGVFVSGADVTLAGLVVRDTLPQTSDGTGGRGIGVQGDPVTGSPSVVTITGSVVERNHEVGVFVGGSEAHLGGVVVRDTRPGPGTGNLGRGLVVEPSPSGVSMAMASVTGSLVQANHDVGISVSSSEIVLAGVVVRDTQPRTSDGTSGSGIVVQDDDLGLRSFATVADTLVERSHDVAILVAGSDATFTGLLVRDTQPESSTGIFGRGMNVQAELAASTATITGSVVERSHDVGILVVSSDVQLSGVVVRETSSRALDDLFGDGILTWRFGELATTTLEASLCENNARAGFANFGSHAVLADSALTCNALDLAGEPYEGQPFSFDDGGGNRCGCGDDRPCAAVSAGLSPPEAVGDSR